jgi:16S rRNA (guanine966-N2)-methyltransferase
VRVIAGTYRGRRLTAPAGASTRPTSDRVREALFSILGPLEGAAVLDLFAGSGALGIEALSRGAARAVFVERGPAAHAALRANLETVGAEPPRAIVVAGDARRALRTARRSRDTYDLVFLDPPYAQARLLAGELSRDLPGVLAADARVVAESDRRNPLDITLPLLDERRYGDTLIRIHTGG